MKSIVAIALLLTVQSVFAQNAEPNKKKVEPKQPRLSNFISYTVNIKDTTSLVFLASTNKSVAEYNTENYNRYMALNVYQQFVEKLATMPMELEVEGGRLIVGRGFEPVRAKKALQLFEYTVESFDTDGNSLGVKEEKVDPKAVSSLKFYEEWKIDPVTMVITKRILGYSVMVKNDDLFTIVTDAACLEKLKANFR